MFWTIRIGVVILALVYFGNLTFECVTTQSQERWLITYGASYTILYLFTLVLIVVANYAEYKFISEKFGTSRYSPARKVFYVGLIYTVSFTVRSAYTFVEMVDW